MTLQKLASFYLRCITVTYNTSEPQNTPVRDHWPKNKTIIFLFGLTDTDKLDDMTMISSRGAIFVSVSTPKAAMEKGKEYNDSASQGGD